jgi:hypothetical protein
MAQERRFRDVQTGPELVQEAGMQQAKGRVADVGISRRVGEKDNGD